MNTNSQTKKILITGGTGSFGNAVLRRFLHTDATEIRIFSRDEKKQDNMRRFYGDDKIKYFLGDVRDKSSIDQAIRGVDLVFHAAALKQVPSCEFFPLEAVQTNVLGCEHVISAAIHHGVKRVILLSTDKAVYPVNAMGMTKALAEKVMVARSRELNTTEIQLCATRYGNVMASRGSVIPLFIEQIKAGKPITVTDLEMTRFMMTLEEAVDLVIYALENMHNGDIFVQKSPAATLDVLIKALLELYQSNNKIQIIGTRHGEKQYETLVNREEIAHAEDLGNYFRIAPDIRDLNYGKYFSEGEIKVSQVEEYTSHNTRLLDVEAMKKLLLQLPMIRKDILGEDVTDIYEP